MLPHPSGSEAALVDLDLAAQDADHVEAQHPGPLAGLGAEALGEPPDATLLRPGDRLGGMAESVGRAGLDLREHQRVAPAQDQVELAVAAAPVAGYDLVAGGLVPAGRDPLAVGAEALAGDGHGGTAISPGPCGTTRGRCRPSGAPRC